MSDSGSCGETVERAMLNKRRRIEKEEVRHRLLKSTLGIPDGVLRDRSVSTEFYYGTVTLVNQANI